MKVETRNTAAISKIPSVGIDIGTENTSAALCLPGKRPEVLGVYPTAGKPLAIIAQVLAMVAANTGLDRVKLAITGSKATAVAHVLGLETVTAPQAVFSGIRELHPDVRTILQLGASALMLMPIEDDGTGHLVPGTITTNLRCAAGSGRLLVQMAKRMDMSGVEELIERARKATTPVEFSGRCAVIAESELVHRSNVGGIKEDLAAGLINMVADHFATNIVRNAKLRGRVIMIGGVARNSLVIERLEQKLKRKKLIEGKLETIEECQTIGAIGASLRAKTEVAIGKLCETLANQANNVTEFLSAGPLKLEKSIFVEPTADENLPKVVKNAALGLDIGSVSTKAVLIDEKGTVLASFYRWTLADPLVAVKDCLEKIRQELEAKGIKITGNLWVATTGSGRHMTGDFLGADRVVDEITAQARGVQHYFPDVDCLLEIGGQDSKGTWFIEQIMSDFFMNKMCAAGTGAFVQTSARSLAAGLAAFFGHPVTDYEDNESLLLAEFSQAALSADKSAGCDDTCTVLTAETAYDHLMQNVPVNVIAAGIFRAMVRTYLKNLGGRAINGKTVFAGATAFNKGMVAAFETVLGLPIYIPPYPHLTGAIGAALTVMREQLEKQAKTSSFRGFEAIAESTYEMSSFVCRHCPNNCEVNVFTLTALGQKIKYFYNDRCERYSGGDKPKVRTLVDENNEMLVSIAEKIAVHDDAPTIAIPRMGMLYLYLPLIMAYFRLLGWRPLVPPPTDKAIAESGIELAVGEPCFPEKAELGQVKAAAEMGADLLFLPKIYEVPKNSGQVASYICPMLQLSTGTAKSLLRLRDREDLKILSPDLHFTADGAYLRNAFLKMAKEELGVSELLASKAFDEALKVQQEYIDWTQARGKEVRENLGDKLGFVGLFRPYAAYNPATNLSLDRIMTGAGFVYIPQEFMPPSEDISANWVDCGSPQGIRKLALVRQVMRDPKLRFGNFTYFGCGPDEFISQWIRDEAGSGEPYLELQIDSATGPAGLITRAMAFAEVCRLAKRSGKNTHVPPRGVLHVGQVGKERSIKVVPFNRAADLLVELLRNHGLDADLLPEIQDTGLTLARQALPRNVCLPAHSTLEYMLQWASRPDFQASRTAFTQAFSAGPCRLFGYPLEDEQIFRRMGIADAMVASLGLKGGFPLPSMYLGYNLFLAHDHLERMLLHVRPYERGKGQADLTFHLSIQQLKDVIPECLRRTRKFLRGYSELAIPAHLAPLLDVMQLAVRQFRACLPDKYEQKVILGTSGEFYVRGHTKSNDNFIRKVEALGAEVMLAPITEFLTHCVFTTGWLAWDRFHNGGHHLADAGVGALMGLNRRLIAKSEAAFRKVCAPILGDQPHATPQEITELGSRWVPKHLGGEAIITMGMAEKLRSYVDALVCLNPFGCIVGTGSSMFAPEFQERYHIPFLFLDYNGYQDPIRDLNIQSLMDSVLERHANRPNGPIIIARE